MENLNVADYGKGNKWYGIWCEGNEWDGLWSEGNKMKCGPWSW